MIFYLHFIMLTGGLCGTSVLLGVYFEHYSDASQGEIGALLMTFPFVAIIIKPLFCSLADRYQAHKSYLIAALIVLVIGYAPFVVIPFFPNFYKKMPRFSWYILVISCHVGNAGLGVAWSLGESLAVNRAQKTNTPYGQMRLTGTVSWGIFGYVIGEINEIPILPKYLPAFLVLITNALLEIVLLALWNDKDFKMCDLVQQQSEEYIPQTAADNSHYQYQQQQQVSGIKTDNGDQKDVDQVITLPQLALLQCCKPVAQTKADFFDSTPSSLGGTLRMNSNTALAMKSIILPDDLTNRLKLLELMPSSSSSEGNAAKQPVNNTDVSSSLPISQTLDSIASATKEASMSGSLGRQIFKRLNNHNRSDESENNNKSPTNCSLDLAQKLDSENNSPEVVIHSKELKNPQLILLRFILTEDGRLVKYLAVFTMFGLLIAPMNFVFLSMVDVCREKGYNFSRLAGSVLISQASVETIGFLVLPWFLNRVSRFIVMAFGLAVLFARYLFYSCIYYTADISPYWALVGEWGHGLSYCIFCTIMADVALMFASESRLFINELRSLGFLSDLTKVSMEQIRIEENAIRIALRATMQALFGGFMDGLGQGSGSLLCGLLADAYSYITLWQLFAILSISTLIVHQCVELSRCRWSDLFKPRKDSKAYVIMQHCGHTKSVTKLSDEQLQQQKELEIKNKAKDNLCVVRMVQDQKSSGAAKPC